VARPSRYKHYVEAAKAEALLACDLYNERRRSRNLEAFFVHMCIAWVNLLQAVFERDGIEYYYRLANGKFERIDSEKKSWDLTKSMKEYFTDTKDPIYQNLEFFVGLRNKVEHRLNEKEHSALAQIIAGKTQALIRNFEATLVEEFGPKESLADILHLPLFLSSLSDGAVAAIKIIRKAVPKGVVSYIDKFDAQIGEETASNAAYDFRVLLIPKTANKTNADMAIEFVNLEALDPDSRKAVEAALVIIRDKQVGVSNIGLLKPGDVVERIKTAARDLLQPITPTLGSTLQFVRLGLRLRKTKPTLGTAFITRRIRITCTRTPSLGNLSAQESAEAARCSRRYSRI
jgi:hypothetical protein